MAMSERFEAIRETARIDNFLAGTSQSPDSVKDHRRNGRRRASTKPCGRRPDRRRGSCTCDRILLRLRRYFRSARQSSTASGRAARPSAASHAAGALLACPAVRLARCSVLPVHQCPPRHATRPFPIQVAERVTRLPPYLFGRINALLYNKRRAGDDVIDLGMGNPSDPPEDFVIDKLAEAARDPRNHGYSKSNGIANLRREVARKYFKRFGVRLDPDEEIIVCLGSKEGFSHMCLAMMGPGDTAIVPAPYFPIHVYSVALASGNVIALEVRDSEKFLSNIAYTCEHLYPRPKLVILNYPHNPSTACIEQPFFDEVVKLARKYGFAVISDFAYADVAFDGYQPPSFLASPGAADVGVEFTTMSKGYNMAGWRVGFCCGNRRDDQGPRHDQRLLRLRHVPGRSDRRHHGAAATATPAWNSKPPSTKAAATRCVESLAAHRLADDAAEGQHVLLGADSRAVAQSR